MSKVFKYPIQCDGFQTLSIPDGVVVFVGTDPNGCPCVWVQHADPNGPRHGRTIYVVGTGHDVPQPSNHLGSFVQSPFVWHVYAVGLENYASVIAAVMGGCGGNP